ncbi:MAG: RraA family protein [Terriglobia bacterium]
MEPLLTAEQFEALRRLDACAVANAVETFDVRQRNEGFTNSSIRCIFDHHPPMLGYAATGRIRSAAAPTVSSLPVVRGFGFADRTDWWSYVLTVPAPRVVVLEDMDHSPGLGAFMGEVHATICQALGCMGYVTNGSVRDLNAVESLGFHFFAGHVSVSHSYVHIVEFGEPVEVGGLQVRPGDLIHGDCHGVQSLPRSIAAQIPAASARLGQKERTIMELCRAPGFLLE